MNTVKRVFVDGSAGTTGLRICDRLAERADLSQIVLPEERRKDTAARKEALNAADIVFLCLPDAAAKEAVTLVENPDTVIFDTSTAHRTAPGWVYGFPELLPTGAIQQAHRIAVPGCHASGFVALITPLVRAGVLRREAKLSCFSLTGYSGGGKSMIAAYADTADPLLSAPRQYGLSQQHKHLREMQAITGLATAPAFCPVVADFYSGMEVTVPVFCEDLSVGKAAIEDIYRTAYPGPVVTYTAADEEGFLSAAALSGRDGMQLGVFGNEERLLLTARYDNLGKGASGAAIQCLNLWLGTAEKEGLVL